MTLIGTFHLVEFVAVALYLTGRLGWFTVVNLETVLQQMRHFNVETDARKECRYYFLLWAFAGSIKI